MILKPSLQVLLHKFNALSGTIFLNYLSQVAACDGNVYTIDPNRIYQEHFVQEEFQTFNTLSEIYTHFQYLIIYQYMQTHLMKFCIVIFESKLY